METQEAPSWSSILGAMLLIGGTAIGGGMLALPTMTGVNGFLPSFLVMLLCWLMMTLSGLLYVEVSLWMKEGAHVISMAQKMLGPWARMVAWVLYLFISYASIIAYAAGVGTPVIQGVEFATGWEISRNAACALFVVGLTGMVFLGSHAVGRFNTLLFFAMVGAYFFLVVGGISHVDLDLLSHQSWCGVSFSIPLILTAFSFQAIVPSMTPYLNSHRRSLQGAIIGGTTVALMIYTVWQLLVLGSIPVEGAGGLREAFELGRPATEFLRSSMGATWVVMVAEFFAFFALVTSFLGMTLGLYDFLADGLSLPQKGWSALFLGLLIVVPTISFANWNPRIFIDALDSTGGFGDAILNGVLPVMMVWVGRYHRHYPGKPLVAGGRVVLLGIVVFFLGALGLELAERFGSLCLSAPMGTLDL